MFESPWLLLGLILLVPVIAAFLFRQRDRVAVVPSTLLFRHIGRARLKNRRLRSILRRAALIACVVGVGSLVLAAAEPRWLGATSSVAIVVDVSASMEGAPMEEAKRALARILRQRAANEHVAIVLAGSEPVHLVGPSDDTTELEAALDGIAVTSGEADLVGALELADRLMRSRRRSRVLVITDGGAASIEDAISLVAPLSALVVGGDRENVGITVLAARPPPDASDDADRDVLVTVAASPGEPRRVRVALEADGAELEARDLTVPGAQEVEARFRLRVPAAQVRARVTPIDGRGDDLASDDQASVPLARVGARTVHLIAREDAPGRFFVERAIRASGVQDVEVHDPASAPTRLADGALAVILGEAPATAIEGPTLFVATTEGELPVHIAGRLDSEDETALRSVDARHALTRGVDLDDATIGAAVSVALPADGEGVLELDGGTVLALGGAGRQRWVYLGIDPSGSDLVLRVAFPVLVANALATLSGATDVRAAPTPPRGEVTLLPTTILAGASEASGPWPVPASPAFLLALLAALVLLAEGVAHFRGWSR